jgi:hypothetical protein
MNEPCEYSLRCGYADENACKYQGCFQECALWRDFVVKEKIQRSHTHLPEKGQINLEEKIARHNANVMEMVVNAAGMTAKAMMKGR